MSGKGSKEYWVTFDAEDVANKLCQHHMRYYGTQFNPIWQMWQRNTYAYYSTVLDSQAWFTALQFVGAQGELVKMSVPQSRALVRQLLTLITKQKLAFNATAQVEGQDITDEVRIANALAEQTVKAQNLDIRNVDMVEDGLVLGTGFMKTTWRTDRGAPVAVKESDDQNDPKSQVIYEGDLEITVPHIMDMLYNFGIQNWEDLDWVECRVRRNRWTLIAQHPELEEQIMKLPSFTAELRSRSYLGFDDDDMVFCYEFYHRPTPALPRGRMVFYSDPKTIYFDDVNTYGCIPIEQFKPEPVKGLGFGYPMLSNLLPAQEMYDHEFSAVATNHSALGVQNIAMPRGCDINVQELLGMNFMWYTPQNVPGGGKPEPLQLTADAPDTFKFAELLLQNMQQMSNINAAVRGEVGSGTSGTAIATLTSNAMEFLDSYSKSDQQVLNKTMMHSINCYRKFAKTDRLVTLTGKNYQAFSKKFKGEDLGSISAMNLQAINPLMQTMAGRIDIADKTAKQGLITDIKEYVSILDGAPLSQLYKSDLSENDLIHAENEVLSQGLPVHALSTDNHPHHILEHKTVLNDLNVRNNKAVVAATNAHILEHNQLQQTTDPGLMAMANTGKAPETAPPGPGGPPAPPMPQGPPPGHPPPPMQHGPPVSRGTPPLVPMAAGQVNERPGALAPAARNMGGSPMQATGSPAKPAGDLLGRGA